MTTPYFSVTGSVIFHFEDALGDPIAVDYDTGASKMSVLLKDFTGVLRHTIDEEPAVEESEIDGDQLQILEVLTPTVHYRIDDIPLGAYKLGPVTAEITATLDDEPLPNSPTIDDCAFIVGDGPSLTDLYCSIQSVKDEIAFKLPDELTDAIIERKIREVMAWIDSRLKGAGYSPFPPFPFTGDTPPTPFVVQHMTREGAVELVLLWSAALNEDILNRKGPRTEWVTDMLEQLNPMKGNPTAYLSDLATGPKVAAATTIALPVGDDDGDDTPEGL